MVVIITFGTFDLLHIGHINMLNKCKKYGDKLIVGVSSDNLNYIKKIDIQYLNKRIELKL
jgi:glycerol-3-phosphate cytidylyltransferase